LQARRIVLELLMAQAPAAELIKELAAQHGIY
jgi:bidirectional [NiFe] hydrogenase diaphorase subunit